MTKIKLRTFVLGLFLSIFVFLSHSTPVGAISSGVDFNSPLDLTDNFNDDGSPVFTSRADGGINNTGSVNVPVPSNDLWITKQSYTVSGAAGSVYTFSAYFKVAQNAGYGNLGFTDVSSAAPDGIGQPPIGLGANFHGGGGAFVNNGSQTILSWPPDLILGNWYWMMFEVTTQGSNTFDLRLQIWNTDQSGVLGTMKTEKTLNGVVNTQMGSATTIHGFFSAAGSRMDRIDGFEMNLEGATFVEEGAPVVISEDAVTAVTASTAVFGGEVIDENGSAVTARGVCWSTESAPSLTDTCITNGAGLGVFTGNLTGLSPNTDYYVRAYATNSTDTSYGAEVTFTTSDGPASDSDGIDDEEENSGPNGGDANDDGTADSMQSNVGSVMSSVTGNYVVLESGSTCTTVDSISMDTEAELDLDEEYMYPDGLMNFSLSGCSVGGAVDIVQYYYGVSETGNLVFRKYNPNNNTYTTINDADIQVVTINSESVVMVTYTVVDGGELDMDGLADGNVVDPAGLALATAGVPDTGIPAASATTFTSANAEKVTLNALTLVALTSLTAWYYYQKKNEQSLKSE